MDRPLQQREGGAVMNCTPPGIEVAKQVFQLHGVDKQGQVVVHGSLAGIVAIFRERSRRIEFSLLVASAAKAEHCAAGV
jgi:hypothetical protein